MERDEDPDEGAGPTALEMAELMQREFVHNGDSLKELVLTQRAYDQLAAECAPCTPEEYFEIPIYITGRH